MTCPCDRLAGDPSLGFACNLHAVSGIKRDWSSCGNAASAAAAAGNEYSSTSRLPMSMEILRPPSPPNPDGLRLEVADPAAEFNWGEKGIPGEYPFRAEMDMEEGERDWEWNMGVTRSLNIGLM